MICPYCGYAKNKDSDTTCQSCGRLMIKQQMRLPYRGKRIRKERIYRPGITREEILRNWSKLTLEEYYTRFCPVKLVRRMKCAATGMWIGGLCLFIWLMSVGAEYFGIYRGPWFYFSGIELIVVLGLKIISYACSALYVSDALNLQKNFRLSMAFAGYVGVLVCSFLFGVANKYLFLLVPPFLILVWAMFEEIEVEQAYKKKKISQEVYGVEIKPLEEGFRAPAKCPHCGYEKNKKDSKTCASCGKRLDVDVREEGRQTETLEKQFSEHATGQEYLERWHVLTIKEYCRKLCPKKLAGQWRAAMCCMAISLIPMIYAFVRWCGMILEDVTDGYLEEYDMWIFGLLFAGSVVVYVLYLKNVTKLFCALDYWWIFAIQMVSVYAVVGVNRYMLCWIFPVLSTLFLQVVMWRILHAYDAKVIREDYGMEM